jgi:hypothetical protein
MIKTLKLRPSTNQSQKNLGLRRGEQGEVQGEVRAVMAGL